MEKTLLVKGLTAGAVGAASTKGALDITEKVLGMEPTLTSPTLTESLYSTIIAQVVEGKAKYSVERKRHINRYNSTAALHDDSNAVGGKTLGAVSTANFKELKSDPFEFSLNKSYDIGLVIDKKKDPKTREGNIYRGIATEMADIKEQKAFDFWTAINGDVPAADASLSTAFPKYVNTTDEKTAAAPALVKEVTATDDAAGAMKFNDELYKMIEDQALMGRVGHATAGYPYARGARDQLANKLIVKGSLIPMLSKDSRFTDTGLSQAMIQGGAKGTFNGVAVYTDDVFETVSHHDAALIPTGSKSPVIVADECPHDLALFDHPTKKTRAFLVEGSGAWDTAVTPFINLCRFLVKA